MVIEQIVNVPANGQLMIDLPPLKNSKQVKVTINEVDEDVETKIALMKKAAEDKDFLADLEEVTKDFENIESKIDE